MDASSTDSEYRKRIDEKSREAISQMVEVELYKSDDFLKVKETLARIGVTFKGKRKLYQSTHILHKQGRYFISHFKSLFLLDGSDSTFDEEDLARLNRIVSLLKEWNMIKVVGDDTLEPRCSMSEIKIVKHTDKDDWEFVQKYNLGKIKNR